MQNVEKILNLLKSKFEGDKNKTLGFLQAHGFATWNELVNAGDESHQKILEKLQSKREYEVIEDDCYIISRPKDIKKPSEMSFTIKGWNPHK
jgi:hypothetical protein